jgi:hypothetical protein
MGDFKCDIPELERLLAEAEGCASGTLVRRLEAALTDAAPALIAAAKALNELHVFECGCDRPGDRKFCVAGKPVEEYKALVALSFEERE